MSSHKHHRAEGGGERETERFFKVVKAPPETQGGFPENIRNAWVGLTFKMASLDGVPRYQTAPDLHSPATHTDGYEVIMEDVYNALDNRILELEEQGEYSKASHLGNIKSVLINDFRLMESYRLSFPPNCCEIVDK